MVSINRINRFMQKLFFSKKKKKMKEVVYLSAIKLIRRFVLDYQSLSIYKVF